MTRSLRIPGFAALGPFRRSPEPQEAVEDGAIPQIDAIRRSGLFDTVFYAAQAGTTPEPDACIEHYVRQGRAAGLVPNPLFDGEAYVCDHPDVAAAGMPAFLHFVIHGIYEGRRTRVSVDSLRRIQHIPTPDLVERRLLNQAMAAGWQDGASAWFSRPVAVYASSLGNFFFRHLADRLVQALRADGVRTYRLDQNSDRPADTQVDIVVAPHEFFHLGAGVAWHERPELATAVILNTEQPGTQWYFLGLRYAGPAATIIDLSPHSAVLLRDFGRPRTGFLPVGPAPDDSRDEHQPQGCLPPVRGLEVLTDEERMWPPAANGWSARPVDVLFLGTLTERRATALARLAPTLVKYRCFIHAPTGDGRPLPGGRGDIGRDQSMLLARRSKVILNVHRDDLPYLEWHRVVMTGIEQGAVVVSEPCLPCPGIEPGRDFIATTLEEMPERIDRVLTSDEGMAFAEGMHRSALLRLQADFDLRRELRALAFLHQGGFDGRA